MRFSATCVAALLLLASPLAAQGTQIGFGGFQSDTSQPVDVAADQLEVDQASGAAVFTGNVLVTQGEMTLSAESLRVEYAAAEGDTPGGISRLLAKGKVVLVNGADAAEADEAIYTIATGTVEMQGNVLLTQGPNVISSEKMTANLETGTARLDGRVRTTLKSSQSE
ncbi:LptA/OstA family protein [Pseudoruegeria sp. SHC-113]|uniref:LptA/OstA family protein n=1 Tax=Pseudoruegeria sp. SHC-113 TaxID=2855439 RepID=UPI0021BB277F|nr:LptA/OstA family protein [Pseudoruegeria sp. SHC-113]MCT8158509.1 LptA/OstA family protein [Pseudoruegeria sp. SHC-113]